MALEFITAVEEKVEGGPKTIPVTLGKKYPDGRIEKRELFAKYPKDGQIAMVMARMSRHATTPDKIAGIIDFLMSVFGVDDAQYIEQRMFDTDDSFGFEDLSAILTGLMEEWGKDRSK